jgi:hypothetical protein
MRSLPNPEYEQQRFYPRDLYPSSSSGISPGLVIGGLVVLGLAAWAMQSLGPDLVRYMKIRSM